MSENSINIPYSSQDTLNDSLQILQKNKEIWITISPEERIIILDEIKNKLLALSNLWVTSSLQAKGIEAQSFGEGEEWMFLAIVLRAIRLIRHSLIDIAKYGKPKIPGGIITKDDGQVFAKVFPQNIFEKILFQGIAAEVWMKPGISKEEVVASQAKTYQDNDHKVQVCLVLAAGNLALISIIDSFYKLFVENQVVILKMNPVNSYVGPILEESFDTLIKRGFIQIVYGGAEEGSYLCNHAAVDQIHITGSNKTFDTIVFGPGESGKKRKAEGNPLLTKRITAELGNITPIIIVPGTWSDKDIYLQALKLTSWLEINAGFNCLAPRLIIQPKNWEYRTKFTDAIKKILAGMKTRNAYYPGAKDRLDAFLKSHPDASQFGGSGKNHLPWTLITDVDPNKKDDICFNTEAFCSLFAETALDASNTVEYINQAVKFANDTVWGTLNATIIVHPKTLKDPQIAAAIEQAIADLKYGSVCLNLRAEYAYLIMLTTWGSFPGQQINNIQSGDGVVGNFIMFDKPQKSVIRGPFNLWPDPFVVTSKRLHKFGKKMMNFEASPSLWKLPGVIYNALRS